LLLFKRILPLFAVFQLIFLKVGDKMKLRLSQVWKRNSILALIRKSLLHQDNTKAVKKISKKIQQATPCKCCFDISLLIDIKLKELFLDVAVHPYCHLKKWVSTWLTMMHEWMMLMSFLFTHIKKSAAIVSETCNGSYIFTH